MAQLGKKEEMLRARDTARHCLAAVEQNDSEIKQLMKLRYRCTGYAFVTFNQYQVAQAVLQELPKRLRSLAQPEGRRSPSFFSTAPPRLTQPAGPSPYCLGCLGWRK